MANKYYLQVHDNNTAQHDENDDTFFLTFLRGNSSSSGLFSQSSVY